MTATTLPATPSKSFFRWLRPLFSTPWRAFLSLVVLIALAFLVTSWLLPSGVKVKEKTALVLDIKGRVVEQRSGGLREQLLSQSGAANEGQVALRDILAVIDAAAKDKNIARIVIATEDFGGAGLASLREIGGALTRFKASGKQIVAWGAGFDQRSYYLAAHADEIHIHPMGGVLLQGYRGYRNYYRSALDKLGISANVIRSGKYKNFAEPYFADGPSVETQESDKVLLDGLWKTYSTDVERLRRLPPGSIAKLIDDITATAKAANGDFARVALESKLVTAINTREDFRKIMIERGALDETSKSFRQVSFDAYLRKIKPGLGMAGDGIGVVVAQGPISDGIAPPGQIGGRSTAELIRKARDDSSIKAIVLRVNSPGGSAYGSELIRRELEITRAAGKPVVVSMGDVAASGGYWVSMAADEVIADEATITGSIGVIGMLPTGEKAMEKLSVSTAGYATTWLGSAMYDARRALDPRMAELVKIGIDRIYADFTSKAAAARKLSVAQVDEHAQGRVWTGAQAVERKLIDRTGSYRDALNAASARAKLPDGARVTYIERDRTPLEKLLERFGAEALVSIGVPTFVFGSVIDPIPQSLSKDLIRDWAWLSSLTADGQTGVPFHALAHCMCEF